MKLLGFVNFNNYFNRKIIRYTNLSDYLNHDFIVMSDKFNFNPNDEISTEILVNVSETIDYVLAVREESSTIDSRWFVMEQERTRGGQYKISLRRDVISEVYESLFNTPMYIQKGILNDSDPLVLNNEGVVLNQIKKEETLLKDNTNSAYLVGYMAKNTDATDIVVDTEVENVGEYINLSQIARDLGIDESVLAERINYGASLDNPTYFTNYFYIRFYRVLTPEMRYRTSFRYDYRNDNITRYDYTDNYGVSNDLYTASFNGDNFKNSFRNNLNNLENEIPTIINRNYLFPLSVLEYFQNINIPIRYLGKYYNINVYNRRTIQRNFIENESYTQYSSIKTICEDGNTPRPNGQINGFEMNEQEVYLQFTEISETSIIPKSRLTISGSRKDTKDAVYDMFVMPLNANIIGSNNQFICNESIVKKIANQIALKLDAKLYDLQLLPYFPMEELENNGKIDIRNLTIDEEYNIIEQDSYNSSISMTYDSRSILEPTSTEDLYSFETEEFTIPDDAVISQITPLLFPDGIQGTFSQVSANLVSGTRGTYKITGFLDINPQSFDMLRQIEFTIDYTAPKINVGVIFYAKKTSFKKILNYTLNLNTSMKVDSNCDFYRLVSPNYQGSFEFNVAKNGGKVDYFIAYCTYKPYTPYIKVVPQFGYLYGTNYGDNRGLICGGDFSIPRIGSAWENYQLNNKNYQNIFNRDIQHLEFEQNIDRRNQIVSGIAGIVGNTATTAGAGAFVGGGWGALAGAVIGAGTSTAGFAVDIATMSAKHKEAKDLAIDKFNMQLGNVKALPYTLTKVSAFDINSKIFPFLEYYSCTDEEKEMFINKIKWESMTVGKIDEIGNYLSGNNSDLHYLKGEIVRLDGIASDQKISLAIYEEFLKGVYI